MSTLLQWALGSVVLILAVLTLRALLGQWLSSRARYALWLLAMARLLVPAQLPVAAPVTLAGLLPEDVSVSADPFPSLPDPVPAVPDGSASVPQMELAPPLAAEDVTVTVTPVLTPGRAAVGLWAAGAVVSGGVLLAVNGSFLLRLRKRRRPLEVPDCPLPVYTAEGLPSPCLFGLFRPAVYLTPEAAALPEEQRRHILAHELTHYAHRDHIWAILRCLCLALHWYNPLVWLAAALSKADGELACDEGAVERLGEEARVPSGRPGGGGALRGPRPADLFQCSPAMTGGKKTLRDRVAALARKPETKKAALFAAAALLALAAVFVFAGQRPVITYEEFCRLAQSDSHTQVQVPSEDGASSILYQMGGNPNLRTLLQAGTASSGTCSAPDKLPYALTILFTDVSDGVSDTYNMVETSSGCELLASRMGEKDKIYSFRRIAVFPAGTAEKVTALAREQGTEALPLSDAEGTLPNYNDFRSQVEQAQAIRVTPSPFSSNSYPDPITDEDLLEEAKTILGTARDLLNVPEELDLSDAEFVSASVTLVNTERDQTVENTYLLYRWNNETYMLVQDDSRYIPIVVMDASENALNSIAKRQWERNMDTPEWRETVMSSALRSYTEIQFQFSHMDVVYPAITDPDLLEQAAEVLRTAGDPGDGTMEEGGAQVSIRDEKGGRLADFPLSNGEMIQTLDRLAMEQRDRNRAADSFINELTQEQLDRANEAFRPDVERPDGRTGASEISCFFTSIYARPQELDLYEFLYCCPLAENLTDEDAEEFRAVVAESGDWENPEEFRLPSDFPLPVHRYPREKVSALLQKYAGVTVEELDWPDSLIYLEEYDAFYNFTSDYGPGTFYCTGGRIEGDVILWSDPHGENGARSVLTLRSTLEGDKARYLIQSFQSVRG